MKQKFERRIRNMQKDFGAIERDIREGIDDFVTDHIESMSKENFFDYDVFLLEKFRKTILDRAEIYDLTIKEACKSYASDQYQKHGAKIGLPGILHSHMADIFFQGYSQHSPLMAQSKWCYSQAEQSADLNENATLQELCTAAYFELEKGKMKNAETYLRQAIDAEEKRGNIRSDIWQVLENLPKVEKTIRAAREDLPKFDEYFDSVKCMYHEMVIRRYAEHLK